MNDSPFATEATGLQRIRPRQRNGLSIEEIENKTSGNYIFSFGFPGSGKTTFQWMMMNYLMNEGPFRTKIDIPDRADGADWEGRSIINSWKNQWIEGRFPDPTASGESDVREIHVRTSTTAGKKIDLDFSFLEVSGELLRQVLPSGGGTPDLAPLLQAYLDNERLKFCVILMLSPDVEENDQLFTSFMGYLEKYFPSLVARMSLGVIVSKPEESLNRLRTYGSSDGQTSFGSLDEEALLSYVNRFCGETFQIWHNWNDAKKTLLAPLSLGGVEEIQGEPRLVEPDFRDIEEIFFWLVEQFTGKAPGPTLMQKLTGRLDWK